jgi:hypothetical protein
LIFAIWWYLLLLPPYRTWATSMISHENSIKISEKEERSLVNPKDDTTTHQRILSQGIERKLLALCDDGSRPVVHYFEVVVRIQPDSTVTGICTLADKMKLGSDINKILSSHVRMHIINVSLNINITILS